MRKVSGYPLRSDDFSRLGRKRLTHAQRLLGRALHRVVTTSAIFHLLSLGGSGREGGVDENQTGGKGGRGAGGGWRRLISGRILL